MRFEPWISSSKHRNESWVEFSHHFSAPLWAFPSPSQHLQWDTGCTCRAQKGTFFFLLEENKQKWAVKAGLHAFTDLTHFDWSLLFVPCVSVSAFSLCPQLPLGSTESFLSHPNCYLLFASLEVGRLKHFSINVLVVEKAESLENFSKITSAVWRNEAKERSSFKVI